MVNQNTPHESSSAGDSDWSPCAAGQLKSLSQRLRGRERREHLAGLARGGAWSLLAVAGCLFLVSVTRSDPAPPFGGINCRECIAMFDQYKIHITTGDDMDRAKLAQVEGHLHDCRRCQQRFHDRFPDTTLHVHNTRDLNQVLLAMLDEPPTPGWFTLASIP